MEACGACGRCTAGQTSRPGGRKLAQLAERGGCARVEWLQGFVAANVWSASRRQFRGPKGRGPREAAPPPSSMERWASAAGS